MVILFDREQHRIRIYVGVPELGAIGDGEPHSQRGQKGGSSICKCFRKKGTPGFPGNRAREVLVQFKNRTLHLMSFVLIQRRS